MNHVTATFTTFGLSPDALPHLLLILFAGIAYGWATKTFKLQAFNLFARCFTALASPMLLFMWIANGGRHRRNGDHARTSHDPDRLLCRTQGNAGHDRPRNYVAAPRGRCFFDKDTGFPVQHNNLRKHFHDEEREHENSDSRFAGSSAVCVHRQNERRETGDRG